MVILIALAAAAAQPSLEALRLGDEIARHGTIAALLPLKEQQDTADLLAEGKTLSPAEQEQLRTTVKRLYADAEKRLFSATGRAYAERLSIADLRAVAAFYRTGAATRFQQALPGVIVATMKSVGEIDLKKDARSDFCKQTGKLCSR
jgi:glutathione S-transferase